MAALLCACGGQAGQAGASPGRPGAADPLPRPGLLRPPAPSYSSSPLSVPTPPPTWTADTDATRGYELAYPPGWAPKAAATGGADHAYYATKDAPAPLEMSHSDVWLTVDSRPLGAGAACSPWLPGVDGGSLPALLAGRQTPLQLRDPANNAVEPTWKAYAVTQAGGRCYVLWFVTLSKETRTAEIPLMLQILAGFTPEPVTEPTPGPSSTPTPVASPSPAAQGADTLSPR